MGAEARDHLEGLQPSFPANKPKETRASHVSTGRLSSSALKHVSAFRLRRRAEPWQVADTLMAKGRAQEKRPVKEDGCLRTVSRLCTGRRGAWTRAATATGRQGGDPNGLRGHAPLTADTEVSAVLSESGVSTRDLGGWKQRSRLQGSAAGLFRARPSNSVWVSGDTNRSEPTVHIAGKGALLLGGPPGPVNQPPSQGVE